MKSMKRAFALLLTLALLIALSVVPAAAEATGTITINDAVAGETYRLYKLFDVTVSETGEDGKPTKYSYTYTFNANSGWDDFFTESTDSSDGKGAGLAWVDLTPTGTANVSTVIWDSSKSIDSTSGDTMLRDTEQAAFARAALAYAQTNNITANKTGKADASDTSDDAGYTASTETGKENTGTLKFENLDLGYYLVDSSLGAMVGLDTADPNGTITEKNAVPAIVKTVKEDSRVTADNDGYGDTNDADIGDTVTFQTTITARKGARNYVVHDTMDAGLTFGSVSKVEKIGAADTTGENPSTVEASNYTVTSTGLTDNCTFEVSFQQTFLDTLITDDKIVITYTATVNENAVIAGAGNTNHVKLTYGDPAIATHETVEDSTTTYTWSFDVFKYTGTDTPLAGATFTLSASQDGSTPISFIEVKNEDNTSKTPPTYRVAKTGETGTVTEITTTTGGKFCLQGLDSGTYYLTETAAPDGYNKLSGPVKVVIAATKDANGTISGSTVTYWNYDGTATDGSHYTGEGTNVTATGNAVKIENKTGTELPSTGGMGTTLFYVLGSILMLGAAVLLVTRRRMSAERGKKDGGQR